MGAVILDAGALIAVERGSPRIKDLLSATLSSGDLLRVPGPVLAQVWRDGARQALLARFLRLARVTVDLLTEADWRMCGTLLGVTGTSDVVDAAVVICARARGATVVVTSDPGDISRLDPTLRLMAI